MYMAPTKSMCEKSSLACSALVSRMTSCSRGEFQARTRFLAPSSKYSAAAGGGRVADAAARYAPAATEATAAPGGGHAVVGSVGRPRR